MQTGGAVMTHFKIFLLVFGFLETQHADAQTCTLANSGPISVSANGQVIENRRITSTSGAAIQINGFSNVIIRDVEIQHSGGPGINFSGAQSLTIENVSVEYTAAPAVGPNPSSAHNNIQGVNSPFLRVNNVRLKKGSSGIYLRSSPNAHISHVEGYDFRGPFPRGQLVQLDKSDNSILEDFSVVNPLATSWTEDNVSVYNSVNCTVRRGLIDGNNSPSGVGVMIEQVDGQVSNALVEDVDAIRMGNGCFSGYPAHNATFRRTKCRENFCTGQAGRAPARSNGLIWAGSPGSSGLRIEQSTYYQLCNPGNLVWNRSTFDFIDISQNNFSLLAPIQAQFCFEGTGTPSNPNR
jgi:hypothetical protein